MKILFTSHVPNQHIKDRDPLGIMCLSASLKKANHEVRICIPEIREMEQMLEEFPADVIAYSIATGDHAFYVDFNRVVKKGIIKSFLYLGALTLLLTRILFQKTPI